MSSFFEHWFAAPARFARESTLLISGYPEARRLRAIALPKVTLGGILGHLYHRLGVPFEWTPLLSLPALAAAAHFLVAGPVWLGVLLLCVHTVNDFADGIATGYHLESLNGAPRPEAKLKLRRMLDAVVSDVASRFVLYAALILRLHETHQVPPVLLAALLVVEIIVIMLSTESDKVDRRSSFHYEFVYPAADARRRFGPGYAAQVVIGQLSSFQNYALLPLLGYLAPLDTSGAWWFALLLVVRLGALGWHLRAATARMKVITSAS